MAYTNQTSNYSISPYIVTGPLPGPFHTIQAAIDQAVTDGVTTTIAVRPGTYNENLTLHSGIDIQGAASDTIIVGTHVLPTSGSIVISNCILQSATDIFNSSAAGTTNILLSSCTFNITSGAVFNLDNWLGDLTIDNAQELSASNYIIFNSTGAALSITNSSIGAGTTGIAVSGVTTIFNSRIFGPFLARGSAVVNIDAGSVIDGPISILNDTILNIYNSRVVSSTSPCITADSTGLVTLENVVLDSSATNVIAGTGQIELGSVTYNDVSVIAGTITYANASLFGASNVNVENILFLNGSAGSSGQVLTSNGVAAPTWAPATGGGGMTWHGSVGEALVANNGYVVVGNIAGGFTLPAAPALGDTFTVASWAGYGANNSWVIYADANHTIEVGSNTAATSIASTVAGDVITLTCVYSASPQYSFLATSVIGNITVTP